MPADTSFVPSVAAPPATAAATATASTAGASTAGAAPTVATARRDRWVYPVAAVLGLWFALWVLGWDFLSGRVPVVRQVSGDNAAGLAALRVYLGEGWGWPLLRADGFGPDGVNIAFTDSIPVLAIVAKVARPLGVAAETWWSAWYLGLYGLQGLAGVFATRSWGARSAAVQLAGGGLALLAPVLLYQSVHPSLSAHFLLLVAWGLSGRLTRAAGDQRPDRRVYAALTLLALAVHPYLAVMILAMLIGSAVDAAGTGRLRLPAAAGWVAVTLLAIGAWLVLGGYFSTISSSDGGYGIYATYLSGPFRPVDADLLPGDPLGPELHPSHPGYSYLGAGVLTAATLGVVLSWRRLGRLVAANQALAAVLGLLFAWAVTPAVRVWSDDPVDLPTRLATVLGSDRAAGAVASAAGVVIGLVCGGLWLATGRRRPQARALLVLSTAILGLSVAGLVVPSVIDALTVQFRASGRFAWPVLYGVATLGLAGLDAGLRDQGRTWRPWLATAAVTAAAVTVVGLQLLDTSTFRHRSRQQLLPGGEERQAHLALLAELAAAHDQVRLDPDFRCVYFPQGVIDFVDITHAASVARTPIDRIYSARQEEPGQCVIPQQPDLSDPATVWFGVEPVSLLDDPTTRAEVGSLCRRRELINVCTHRWDSLSPEIAAYFGPLDD